MRTTVEYIHSKRRRKQANDSSIKKQRLKSNEESMAELNSDLNNERLLHSTPKSQTRAGSTLTIVGKIYEAFQMIGSYTSRKRHSMEPRKLSDFKIQNKNVFKNYKREQVKEYTLQDFRNVIISQNCAPKKVDQLKDNAGPSHPYTVSDKSILYRSITEHANNKASVISIKQAETFLQLCEDDSLIREFLRRDVCHRYADKYLIAMAFTYFVRSKISLVMYDRLNFFAALFLAHEMEEDEDDLKYELAPWALGPSWRKRLTLLYDIRNFLFWSIDCRAVVSRKCCDEIMQFTSGHWVWDRERPEYHGGAVRDYMRHPDDNGEPRGPNRSPLNCAACIERNCPSEDSFLLLLSIPDELSDTNSSDETSEYEENKTMRDTKDSGFNSYLSEKSIVSEDAK